MLYRIHPIAHWTATLLGFSAVNGILYLYGVWAWWAVPVAWAVSLLAGFVCGSEVLRFYPRAIYVNDSEIYGMGYVHSNVNWMLTWTVFVVLISSIGVATAAIMRNGH